MSDSSRLTASQQRSYKFSGSSHASQEPQVEQPSKQSKMTFSFALMVLTLLLFLFHCVFAVPATEIIKRGDRGMWDGCDLKWYQVKAPPENICDAAAEMAACLDGQVPLHDHQLMQYIYNVVYDGQCVGGPIFVGDNDLAAFSGACGFEAIQYYYDAAHCSLNRTTEVELNLVVKQSCDGEVDNIVFCPPSNEYWVVNPITICEGQVELYGVSYPGWSVCKKCNNGVDYYQVHLVKPRLTQLYYQNFGEGCAAMLLYETDCPPP
jgi:hypothetical protein